MEPEPRTEPGSALSEALRELGRPSTPEELAERGVSRVRTISAAEIARIVEQAVNRTLMARTRGVGRPEMELMLAGAQSSLLGLVRSAREIERSRDTLEVHRSALKAELGALRDERERGERARATQETDEERWEFATRLRGSVRTALLRTRGSQSLAAVEDEIVAAVLGQLAVARARDAFDRDEDIERLERRVDKLVRSLEETEEVLRRVAATKDLESGIESLYRVVQGLAPEDERSAMKRDMLDLIFEANVELRDAIDENAPRADAAREGGR